MSASDPTLAQAAVLASHRTGAKLLQSVKRLSCLQPGSPRVLEKSERNNHCILADQRERHLLRIIGHTIGGGSTIYAGGRTDQVPENMLDRGMIQQAEYTKALADLQTMTFAPARENIRAPHFVLWIEKQIETIFNLNEQNLTQAA